MAETKTTTEAAKDVRKPETKVSEQTAPVEKKSKDAKKAASINLDNYKVVKYPLSTEKSLRLMESENKLIFAVDKKARKADIKVAIEDMFKAKVLKVNTMVTQNGEKRAYVTFSMDTPAIDIATNMGLM